MTPPKANPEVAERTPPEAAIERLALWLNLQEGEDLPLNRVASQAGLAWATASKYIALIERLQNLVPRCERVQGGIRVTQAAAGMRPILEDEASASALALMLQSQGGGEIVWRDAPIRLQTGLDELKELEAVVQQDGGWNLTPSGWVLANDAYGQVIEGKHKPRNGEAPVLVYVSDAGETLGLAGQTASALKTRTGIYRPIRGLAMEEQASSAA